MKRVVAVICLVIAGIGVSGQATVIYVDDDAVGMNDGSSWTDAFAYLQDALATVQPGDEIRVAQGIYRPDENMAFPEGTGILIASFKLLDGVAIMGGFAGVGAPDPDARDITCFETILSGDLAEDDVPVADPCDLLTEPTRSDNSFAIVTARSCSRSAILDGFTIAAGHAGGRAGSGAGLLFGGSDELCSPSVRNCSFIGHSGSAVCASGLSYPEFVGCTFAHNACWSRGGAINIYTYTSSNTEPSDCDIVIERCTFIGNYSAKTGGAVYVHDSSYYNPIASVVTVDECVFMANTAQIGGAVYVDDTLLFKVANCHFVCSRAAETAGAIYFWRTQVDMRSCTLVDNVAPCARACYAGYDTFLSVRNTILWDGGDEIGIDQDAFVDIAYSNVQNGWPGEGNVDADPLFANLGYWDPNNTPDDPYDDYWVEGDYHLQSQGGRWDPNSATWVIDDVTSPCIDAGDPNSPIGLEPFPNGGYINIGAYGGTAEASKSYFGEPLCETIMTGDINGDCRVDSVDLAILLSHWQEEPIRDR